MLGVEGRRRHRDGVSVRQRLGVACRAVLAAHAVADRLDRIAGSIQRIASGVA
jgi:hypothetical protein